MEKKDTVIPRRKYDSNKCSLTICPECSSPLVEEETTILLAAKSEKDEGTFITNLSGTHFCEKCPVVVFDIDKVGEAATLGIRRGRKISYIILGIVDLDRVPENKRNANLGSDGNPMPIVKFLPPINNSSVVNTPKIGRNEPCTCGSGKKYKHCHGKS